MPFASSHCSEFAFNYCYLCIKCSQTCTHSFTAVRIPFRYPVTSIFPFILNFGRFSLSICFRSIKVHMIAQTLLNIGFIVCVITLNSKRIQETIHQIPALQINSISYCLKKNPAYKLSCCVGFQCFN